MLQEPAGEVLRNNTQRPRHIERKKAMPRCVPGEGSNCALETCVANSECELACRHACAAKNSKLKRKGPKEFGSFLHLQSHRAPGTKQQKKIATKTLAREGFGRVEDGHMQIQPAADPPGKCSDSQRPRHEESNAEAETCL